MVVGYIHFINWQVSILNPLMSLRMVIDNVSHFNVKSPITVKVRPIRLVDSSKALLSTLIKFPLIRKAHLFMIYTLFVIRNKLVEWVTPNKNLRNKCHYLVKLFCLHHTVTVRQTIFKLTLVSQNQPLHLLN